MTASQASFPENSDEHIMFGTGDCVLPKISIGVPVQQSTLKTELSSLSLKVNDTKLPSIYSTAAGGCLCRCPNYTVHMLRLRNHRYKLQLGAPMLNNPTSTK